MRRRHIIYIVIVALLLPQMAGALPRPDGAFQSESPTEVARFTVAPGELKTTPVLTAGRLYTVLVTGYFKPSSDANHFADAGFETTAGLNDPRDWERKGFGLEFAGTNLGGDASPLNFRSDHQYELSLFEGKGRAENVRILTRPNTQPSGSLTIRVLEEKKVRWIYAFDQPVTLGVPATDPFDTPTVTVIPTMTVENKYVPTTTVQADLPLLARVNITTKTSSVCGSAFKEWLVTVNIGGTPVGPTSLGCLPSDINPPVTQTSAGGPTPEQAPVIAEQRLCPANSGFDFFGLKALGTETECHLSFTIPMQRYPGTQPIHVLEPGSSVEILTTWSADRSLLWKTFVNDRDPDCYTNCPESYAVWAPFNPQSTAHRQAIASALTGCEIQALVISENYENCGLGASFAITIYGPNRRGLFTTKGPGRPNSIPLLGQFIEAIFASRVEQVEQ